MSSESFVYLCQRAQRDLARLDVGSGREIGAGVMGRFEGRQIYVAQIVENRFGPDEPDSTDLDYVYFASLEETVGADRDEIRLLGSLHSHETYEPGGPLASDADFNHMRELAMHMPGQDGGFAALIVGPGFHSDWRKPRLRAWHARRDGSLWTVPIVREDAEYAELCKQVRFPPRRSWTTDAEKP